MPGGIVIHIESGRDKHTEVLSHERIRIGSGAACELRLRASALPSHSDLVLELEKQNGSYRVAGFDPALALTHNGEPLRSGSEINDGDEVRVRDVDLALQFFPVRALPALVERRRADIHVAPFIESAALESAATERRDDAKVFLREFTRELVREINTSTKVLVFLIVGALVGGLLYLGFAANRELERSRDLINKQNEQLAAMEQRMGETQQQFARVDERNQSIIDSLSLAPQIRSAYGGGVGLLTGSYILVEVGTGRPMRYPEFKVAEGDEAAPEPTAEQPSLTAEGAGEPFEREFAGTAFHVGKGYVITNRHLTTEPWRADPSTELMTADVKVQFRITRLAVYFPGHKQPFPLRVKQTSQREDLAVCMIEGREVPAALPVLPVDPDSDASGIGKTVVMLSYPTSEDRILATLPEAESIQIQQRYGSSLSSILNHLAARNFIRPLLSQGSITDFEGNRIVYEANSAEGASGAPLFGQTGRVIAVNFGMFTQMQNVNFASPIRFAVPLLERAGWKMDEPAPDANTNSNAAASAKDKDSRPASATNQSR
ncbi:MAG TPA: trypsin-like peptidase domain-containing protein [Pyrinomonadaceae bacterium]|nr:trypsin-like peptidase domain-containing protein [Pyrinomonadaceae bacterium]